MPSDRLAATGPDLPDNRAVRPTTTVRRHHRADGATSPRTAIGFPAPARRIPPRPAVRHPAVRICRDAGTRTSPTISATRTTTPDVRRDTTTPVGHERVGRPGGTPSRPRTSSPGPADESGPMPRTATDRRRPTEPRNEPTINLHPAAAIAGTSGHGATLRPPRTPPGVGGRARNGHRHPATRVAAPVNEAQLARWVNRPFSTPATIRNARTAPHGPITHIGQK